MIFERIALIITGFLVFILMLYMGVTERKKYKEAEKAEKEASSRDDKLKFGLIKNLYRMYRSFLVFAFMSLGISLLGIIVTVIDLVAQ